MRAAAIACVTLSLLSVGCGGPGVVGEAILGGEIAGDFQGTAFAPAYGFARAAEESEDGTFALEIFLSDQPITCDDDIAQGAPGTYAVIYLDGNEVGHYEPTFIQYTRISDTGEASTGGSGNATVDITESVFDRVAATIAYDDTIASEHYSLNGSFAVFRCPE